MKTTNIKTTVGFLLLTLLALPGAASARQLFRTADGCIACHNGLQAPDGRDISIGFNWRPSMMANSARDPYWQAGVRREVLEHPRLKAAIEDKCATCHMPATRFQAKQAGKQGQVFAHLPLGQQVTAAAALAADGVTCTLCHQITERELGSEESFTGGFVVDTGRPWGKRRVYGPYTVDAGRTRVMRSASEFEPAESKHLARSEVCATCHTLYTHAYDQQGNEVGRLPEQVPYLEWKHSAYAGEQSCQDCHMPAEPEKVAISSVLGQPRENAASHAFLGGNFFMPRLFNRYRVELGLQALPQELEGAAHRAARHLQTRSARVTIAAAVQGDRLVAEVTLTSLAGHKLPTAYPSRRAWLQLTVRDGGGRPLFESGALESTGAIRGNDNDRAATQFEPHYREITRPDQVQIYEAILADHRGDVTTGLLKGVRYIKDNRVLPRGFDKAKAPADVAVQGAAARDPDFVAGVDRVRYRVPLGQAKGPFTVEAWLWYQPIAYRWAENLALFKAAETRRFVSYFKSMPGTSTALRLTGAALTVQPAPASAPAAEEQQ